MVGPLWQIIFKSCASSGPEMVFGRCNRWGCTQDLQYSYEEGTLAPRRWVFQLRVSCEERSEDEEHFQLDPDDNSKSRLHDDVSADPRQFEYVQDLAYMHSNSICSGAIEKGKRNIIFAQQ